MKKLIRREVATTSCKIAIKSSDTHGNGIYQLESDLHDALEVRGGEARLLGVVEGIERLVLALVAAGTDPSSPVLAAAIDSVVENVAEEYQQEG